MQFLAARRTIPSAAATVSLAARPKYTANFTNRIFFSTGIMPASIAVTPLFDDLTIPPVNLVIVAVIRWRAGRTEFDDAHRDARSR
jgi:hypothetical protein